MAAAQASHLKICDYTIMRNCKDYYTYQVEPHVTSVDVTKLAWKAEPTELKITVEDGHLVFRKEGEEFGGIIKLGKQADLSASLQIVTPNKGGLFVSIPKKGATGPIEPLDKIVTGDHNGMCFKDDVQVDPRSLFPDGTFDDDFNVIKQQDPVKREDIKPL